MNVPKMDEVQLASKPLSEDASNVLDLVEKTPVENEEDLRTVVAWVAEIKTKSSEVDNIRKSFTDPLRKVVDDVNNFFRPALDSLKDAEAGIKKKIVGFTTDRLEERDRILQAIDIDESEESKAEAIEKAEKLQPPKVSGLSIRESWDGELVDEDKLIDWAIENDRRDLLLVNQKALKALTKSLGRDPKISGWRASLRRTVAVTTSKV